MSNIDEMRASRLKKIVYMRSINIDPYPAKSFRTHTNADFIKNFNDFLSSAKTVVIVGRIMSIRQQGGIAFIDIFDGTARVQSLVKKDDIGPEEFKLFEDVVDASDFIEISGKAFTTKRGVNSIQCESWRMLAKSIRPIPDEWFGLKDEDERYRKRYIDMILNPDIVETIKKRSIFWNTIRTFMLGYGFIEVETPVLETMTGGADARPFITHHNALDMEAYLRISVGELWQKKLMIGGLPKTFEIGRIFRNEGISHEHAQDYTSFEFYEAYQDAHEGVPMIIDLYRTVAEKTFGTLKFKIGNFNVDLGKNWDTVDFNDLMQQTYSFDPRTVDQKTVISILNNESIPHNPKDDISRGVDLLWKKIRKTIAGPMILVGIPVYLETLAKKSTDDPRVVQRFQILIAGSELGKAFNELNDPEDQRERFLHQQSLREAGDDEAQMADLEYVEALEYAMPPTFGFGVSERLFSFLAGKSIREAQIFPLMRRK